MASVGHILFPSTQFDSVVADGGIDLTGISSTVGSIAGYFVVRTPFLTPRKTQDLTIIFYTLSIRISIR